MHPEYLRNNRIERFLLKFYQKISRISRLFGVKCMRCGLPVQSTDYVYRVFASIYHLQCFKCFCCGHLFKKGDHYMLIDGQVICRPDYEHLLCQTPICQSHLYFDQNDSNRKTPKRPRTILNTQQRKAFKLAFEKTSKPCRKVREQLAKETNLSVRVVQVWFQNQRAKMKKIQRKQEVSETNDATCSEMDIKSNDELKSNCDSADELDSENDDVEVDDVGSSEEKGKESNNPIAQLFHMHATYFLA
uniref:Homeobox domain-containing protein n=1 Tax=Elaeophora elaphi TaxID=1147741 RepID=A0A0R3RS98_9BILA